MRRRARNAMLAAVLLIGTAAFLMWASEEPMGKAVARTVEWPRWMREEEHQRVVARRVLPPRPVASPTAEAAPPRPLDPFLEALPRDQDEPLIVLEANALRHSRLGELFVDCVVGTSRTDPFDEMRREAGIDPLKDIDRVAFSPAGIVVSGYFDRARLDQLQAKSELTSYGDHGQIFQPRMASSGGTPPASLGAWRGQLLVFGSRSFVQEAIDRVEGRAQAAPSVIPEELTYGEAYGVLPGAALQRLLGGAQTELGRRLASAAPRVELHVDAMHDVAAVARVTGADAEQLDDLGKSLGAALSLLRLDAKARGQSEIADLLEHARVEPRNKGFTLEVALPIEAVERWFDHCGAEAPASASHR